MISDEATREFLVESHEGLDQLDREFVALEDDPSAPGRIATIFRIIHTIKGTSGFLGYSRLEALTHAGESLLSMLRDGALALTPAMTSALLSLVDRVRAMLRDIEAGVGEGEEAHADLLERLALLRDNGTVPPPAPAPALVPLPAVAPAKRAKPPRSAGPATPGRVTSEPIPEASVQAILEAPRAEAPPTAEAERATEPAVSAVTDSNVRVDVGLLDKLMNLVGELVLARNQILQVGSRVEDTAFVRAGQRLNFITTELQEHIMRTRMQPIGNVWSKLPRVVRDLAIACGKQVRVEMIGKETELDRTILEAIKDPLTHIVRNAVDHGLEAPDVRAQRGKPRTGSLVLRAYHQGGQVNIEISDDGGGINLDRVRHKAIERKLVTAEQAEGMNEYELTQLVFLPGFSTAEAVTNVSGRGVGMDVVKTNIERIGGTIDLSSRSGNGTLLKIRIPLTLAIVPALIVTSGDQRFAIPQTNLLELVRLEGDTALQRIEHLHGAPVFRLRGRLLPLVYLNSALGLPEARAEAPVGASVNIIVLQADEGRFGLIVDEVRDTEEIVVKPLGKELRGIPVFAGATIMGDGQVALILDVVGLAQHANAVSRVRESAIQKAAPTDEAGGPQAEKQSLLLFTTDRASVMALPLSMVARLEEFPVSSLERSGSGSVVQYRGEILPLIELADYRLRTQAADDAPIPVIVYSEGSRRVGFVVGRILDVVEDAVKIDARSSDMGVLGRAIIQGRITELMDVQSLLHVHAPWFFEDVAA